MSEPLSAHDPFSGLGAFAITFERPAILRRTIERIDAQTVRPAVIWVIDNSITRETEQLVQQLDRPDVRYHRMGHNSGPAGGAAAGLELLRREGYRWAYWIDDDDPPLFPDTLARLAELVRLHDHVNAPIAGVGAVGHRFSWRTGLLERTPDERLKSGPVEVDMIGGGQQFVVSLDAVARAGGPRAELFFAFEDLDLCLRFRAAGFRLLVDGDLMRAHREQAGRIGLKRRRHLRPQSPLHTLWRQYYSSRNYVEIMRMHRRTDLAFKWGLRCLLKASTSWSRGATYGATYSLMSLQGLLDGCRGRLGMTISPRPKA